MQHSTKRTAYFSVCVELWNGSFRVSSGWGNKPQHKSNLTLSLYKICYKCILVNTNTFCLSKAASVESVNNTHTHTQVKFK